MKIYAQVFGIMVLYAVAGVWIPMAIAAFLLPHSWVTAIDGLYRIHPLLFVLAFIPSRFAFSVCYIYPIRAVDAFLMRGKKREAVLVIEDLRMTALNILFAVALVIVSEMIIRISTGIIAPYPQLGLF